MNKLIFIILVNWNGWQDTVECVDSCRKLTYKACRVLIVDNGSTDNSEEILSKRFPDIEIIQTGSNLGFAGGNNVGINYALSQGADGVWLLNNDTIADPDALSELVNVAESAGDVGIVGSKIFYFNDPKLLWFAGGRIFYPTANCEHIGQSKEDDGSYDLIVEVDYITGCSLLITRKAVESAGLMDERFFLLFEEADWNVRVRRNGFKILYAPSSVVWHKVSRSFGGYSPKYFYYLFRNSLLFTIKHNPLFLPVVIIKRLKEVLVFYKKGSNELGKAGIKGVSDFCAGKFGIMKN